jgi:hypothetical protein
MHPSSTNMAQNVTYPTLITTGYKTSKKSFMKLPPFKYPSMTSNTSTEKKTRKYILIPLRLPRGPLQNPA